MIEILDIVAEILPEIIMACITFLVGMMYRGIKRLKIQIDNSHKIERYLLKENILNDYEKAVKQGYCSVEMRRKCVDEYMQYKFLGGNGGMEKVMEEIHDLPIKLKRKGVDLNDKLESANKK